MKETEDFLGRPNQEGSSNIATDSPHSHNHSDDLDSLAVLDSLPGFIHLLTVIYGSPTLPDAVDAMASEKR